MFGHGRRSEVLRDGHDWKVSTASSIELPVKKEPGGEVEFASLYTLGVETRCGRRRQ